MQLKICNDYETLSSVAATEIIQVVKKKPDAVLCIAAGDTPRLTCVLLANKARQENIDFSKCTFIGLDEWVGIPPENEGSCGFFLQHMIFNPLHISPLKIHLFNAMSGDLEHDCKTMDNIIFQKGGIDLMLVGIGMNGHIGFNEPGVSFNKYSHVIDLDDATQTVGQKYFTENTMLKKGITLGLNHLVQSKKVILVANGAKKAEVIRKALEGEISEDMPASIVRLHPQSMVIIEEEAASLLTKKASR